MRVRNGNVDIKLPEMVRPGDEITAKWANSIRGALQRLRDRTPVASPERPPTLLKPFEVTLGGDGLGTYYVTVENGKVCEREMTAGDGIDALLFHSCDNRLDVNNYPAKFAITVGQAIFVNVLEDNNGRIQGGADLVLVVASSSTISTNYIPDVQDGSYYYKLAELESYGDSVRLVHFLSGSNIYHPTGLTADIVLRDCPVYPVLADEAPIILRASFVSGKLVAVGDTEAARALADTVDQTNVAYCT